VAAAAAANAQHLQVQLHDCQPRLRQLLRIAAVVQLLDVCIMVVVVVTVWHAVQ
jgi:hypothetical protein